MIYMVKKDELYHHGILGQKWGKRNGPPYPLGSGDHSASEKKAGWRKSLNKKSVTERDRNENLGRLFSKDIKRAKEYIINEAKKDEEYTRLLEITKQDREIRSDYKQERKKYVSDSVDFQLKNKPNLTGPWDKERMIDWYLNDDGDQGDYNSFQFFAVKNRRKYGENIDGMFDNADYHRELVDKTIDRLSSKISGRHANDRVKLQGTNYTNTVKNLVTTYLEIDDQNGTGSLLSSYMIAYDLDSSPDVYSDIKNYYGLKR